MRLSTTWLKVILVTFDAGLVLRFATLWVLWPFVQDEGWIL